MPPIAPALLAACALILAGCTTSPRVSASADTQRATVRAVAGTALIGARGLTPADQDAIDDTAAGLCGAGAWTPSECKRHGDR